MTPEQPPEANEYSICPYCEDIAEMGTDLKWLKQWASNHMAHHFKFTFWALTGLIVAIVTLAWQLLQQEATP